MFQQWSMKISLFQRKFTGPIPFEASDVLEVVRKRVASEVCLPLFLDLMITNCAESCTLRWCPPKVHQDNNSLWQMVNDSYSVGVTGWVCNASSYIMSMQGVALTRWSMYSKQGTRGNKTGTEHMCAN